MKPPKVSGEKPWHQDAAYFRGSDPNLMFGVWIALDPATRENGCMEVIPDPIFADPPRTFRPRTSTSAPSGPIWSGWKIASPCPWTRGCAGVPQPDPPLHRGQPLRTAAPGAAVPLPSGRPAMDIAGGAPNAVSRCGRRLCRLHRGEGRAVRRSLQLCAEQVAAGRADGIAWRPASSYARVAKW